MAVLFDKILGKLRDASSGAGTDHNTLTNLQGGTLNEYYHLTSAELTIVQNTSGTNTGDQTLPVKASGSELDTGTDDAKFATAKALKDSHNVPSVAPGTSGNVLTSNGTDWTSVAPTSGGDMYLANIQSVTGLKTFDKDKIAMKGTSTGVTTISTANTSATNYTATLPAADGTILYTNGSAANLTNFPTLNQNTTGNAATVTVADSGADTTTWVLLGTSQTGNLSPATDAGITYNASTNALTASTFVGALTGNATTATTLATARAIYGNNFDGSAALTGVIASTYGGTGNGFTKFTGPTTSEKTFTLPDASATLARTDAGQTFTGVNTFTSPKIITSIDDTNGNELLKVTATASAVNELTLANAATGGSPTLSATGGDTNIDLIIKAKGTGGIAFQNSGGRVSIGNYTNLDGVTTNATFLVSYSPNINHGIVLQDTRNASNDLSMINCNAGAIQFSTTSSGTFTGAKVLSIAPGGIPNFLGTFGDSTKNPETQAESDWLEIKLNGTQYFIPLYSA